MGKIESLQEELNKLEAQQKIKMGEFMLDVYQSGNWDVGKIKVDILKILGEEEEFKMNATPEVSLSKIENRN